MCKGVRVYNGPSSITYGTLWEQARQTVSHPSHGGWSKLLQQYILNLSLNHCLKVLLPEYIYLVEGKSARAHTYTRARRVIYALRFDDEGRSDVYVILFSGPRRRRRWRWHNNENTEKSIKKKNTLSDQEINKRFEINNRKTVEYKLKPINIVHNNYLYTCVLRRFILVSLSRFPR